MDDHNMALQSGISAFEAKDFTLALRLLSPLADEGNSEAQYRLAMMFHNGLGRVGHAFAQHGLGVMYLYGECTEKDESKAAEWFRRAAEQGLPGAQMTLGMLYENGQGVQRKAVRKYLTANSRT